MASTVRVIPSGIDTYIVQNPMTNAEKAWREGQDWPFVFLSYKGFISSFSYGRGALIKCLNKLKKMKAISGIRIIFTSPLYEIKYRYTRKSG